MVHIVMFYVSKYEIVTFNASKYAYYDTVNVINTCDLQVLSNFVCYIKNDRFIMSRDCMERIFGLLRTRIIECTGQFIQFRKELHTAASKSVRENFILNAINMHAQEWTRNKVITNTKFYKSIIAIFWVCVQCILYTFMQFMQLCNDK